MKHTSANAKEGFIALLSAVIVSAVLLSIMFSSSISSWYAREDSLGAEQKSIALALAQACGQAAFLSLAQNYFYDPAAVVVAVGSHICTIVSITPHAVARTANSAVLTIQTKASYQGSFSNYQAQATVYNPAAAATVLPPIIIDSSQENP